MSLSLLVSKIEQALSEVGQDSRRLFHGRGQCFPGLESVVVDYYSPVILLSLFQNMGLEWEQALVQQLGPVLESSDIQGLMIGYRYIRDTPAKWVWQRELPDDFYARRGELRFTIKLGERQNSGYFLDMEPGRRWLEGLVEGRKLLNLFSYTCAFSVVAAAAGAVQVVNVDMARGALRQGKENHQLNEKVAGVGTCRAQFLGENIFKSWGRIKRPGPYDVIIIDPPSFQKGSFIARSDYGKVLRRIPQLATNGADILICLNAPELGVDFIQQAMIEECPECSLVTRLSPSEDFPDVNPDQQLKLFHYQYRGEYEPDKVL